MSRRKIEFMSLLKIILRRTCHIVEALAQTR